MRINWPCLMLWWMLSAGSALAAPITYDFNGALNNGDGTVTGQFTVDLSLPSFGTSSTGGAVFPLSSLPFTFATTLVHPTFGPIPTMTGTPEAYCLGTCIFGNAATVTTLQFLATSPTTTATIRLAFQPVFGAFIPTSSTIRTVNDDGSFHSLILMNSGSLTQVVSSVPEPSTWALLLVCGVVWGVLYWKEERR